MVIVPDERELSKCAFCFKYFTEGYWCANTKTLRCNKCQKKDKMMTCRSPRESEHPHILITHIKIKEDDKKNVPAK